MPLEHIYLDLAVLPILYVLSVRRMIYLQVILKRHDDEITRKIYRCQKNSPLPGDWCQLIADDFDKMNFHMSDDLIAQMPEAEYKKLVKKAVYDTAFNQLQLLKESHSKVRENIYSDLKHMQPYFSNIKLSNRQISIMFALRSKTIRNIKSNFPNMYSSLLCPLCKTEEDTQEHLFLCTVLQNILPLTNHTVYDHMGGISDQQTDFLRAYKGYIKIRDELLDCSGLGSSLPGLYTGPVLPQAASSGLASGNDAAATRN